MLRTKSLSPPADQTASIVQKDQICKAKKKTKDPETGEQQLAFLHYPNHPHIVMSYPGMSPNEAHHLQPFLPGCPMNLSLVCFNGTFSRDEDLLLEVQQSWPTPMIQ